jgi:hypothetical protein
MSESVTLIIREIIVEADGKGKKRDLPGPGDGMINEDE